MVLHLCLESFLLDFLCYFLVVLHIFVEHCPPLGSYSLSFVVVLCLVLVCVIVFASFLGHSESFVDIMHPFVFVISFTFVVLCLVSVSLVI